MRARLAELARTGRLPDADYLLNHVVNRIPLVGTRMRAYVALRVHFDDVASANIALGVEMWGGPDLSMGRRSTIGQRCYIDARAGLRIEHDVSISRGVSVLTATHAVDDPGFAGVLAPVHFGDHSFIGLNALVLPGVRIGEGAVVGAGAVVSSDVEPYTVVGGVPAKPIGRRREPMAYELDWRRSWY